MRYTAAEETAHAALRAIIILGALTVGLSWLIIIVLNVSITRPLNRIVQAANRIAAGDLSGAELAQRLLVTRPNLPVILCNGFSEIINEEKAKGLGIRRLLMKPVLCDELARVLRQVLDPPEE
jgi:methyl-accepting chemotaxis protein